jgi:hypothetical protein
MSLLHPTPRKLNSIMDRRYGVVLEPRNCAGPKVNCSKMSGINTLCLQIIHKQGEREREKDRESCLHFKSFWLVFEKYLVHTSAATLNILSGIWGFHTGGYESCHLLDITPCSPLSDNRRFGRTYSLHPQSRKNKFSKRPACTQVASLLNLFFRPKRRLTLNGLHGVIGQKMVLFILS